VKRGRGKALERNRKKQKKEVGSRRESKQKKQQKNID